MTAPKESGLAAGESGARHDSGPTPVVRQALDALEPERLPSAAPDTLEGIQAHLRHHLDAMALLGPATTMLNRCVIERTVQVGNLLLSARKLVAKKHGEWLPWLEANCAGVTVKTCQNYMRFAVWAEDNAKHVSHLESLREGYLLAGIIKLPKVKKTTNREDEHDADTQEHGDDGEDDTESEDSREDKAQQDELTKTRKAVLKLGSKLAALPIGQSIALLDDVQRIIVEWCESIRAIKAKQEANKARQEAADKDADKAADDPLPGAKPLTKNHLEAPAEAPPPAPPTCGPAQPGRLSWTVGVAASTLAVSASELLERYGLAGTEAHRAIQLAIEDITRNTNIPAPRATSAEAQPSGAGVGQ